MQRLSLTKSGLSKKDFAKLKALSSPQKIQDYLNNLPFNFEDEGQTHRSVEETLRAGEAHCFEGALIAAASFWIQGEKPLVLDLKVIRPDFDHILTLFKIDGHWGAISKTNHAVLRYRDPIYKSPRELVMSYFNEYFWPNGIKTLRSYSEPFDLSKLGTFWLTSKENLADLAHTLDKLPHKDILTKKQERGLRRADMIEREAADIVEWE